ncbi:MAG: WecB/TagA/CpsF family glycosyltransferase [Patescibacteria group bacterium]|nr:WecB/TagA/CpsF family glycosyltransferase [Patescibacteria group bacterium]
MLNILGVNISTLEKEEVLKKIEQFLKDGKQHYIVTPNPEIILEARRDEELFYILNKADLAIPDGAGLKFAALAMGRNLRRVTGADLVGDLLKNLRFTIYDLRFGVMNWKGGLSKKEDIEKVLAEFKIKDFFVKDISRDVEQDLSDLVKFKPDILFCAFGAPYQEKFIYHNLPNLPSVKVAIGVGGAFDFLTGKIKRAPKIMRWLCLEWLWRLAKQPHRVKRIYQAVIIFPLKFIKWRFIHPLLYRPNVVCLLYRKSKNGYEILLAERKNEPGHWQLLQGGTEGEDLMRAGARELREEIDTDKFKGVAAFPDLWKYKFGNNSMCRGVPTKYVHGYKGQKQGLFIAEFLGEDKDITINFWDHKNWKWVKADNLITEVHPVRREAARIFLEKFKNRITHNA